MKKTLYIFLGMLLLTACYKDEIDLDSLDHNPFDRDYQGPAMFEYIGTYQQAITIGNYTTIQQVIEFRVLEEHFLEPAVYQVHVVDQTGGVPGGVYLNPSPPGSNLFKHITAPASGTTVCLELRLANELSTAAAEVLCVAI